MNAICGTVLISLALWYCYLNAIFGILSFNFAITLCNLYNVEILNKFVGNFEKHTKFLKRGSQEFAVNCELSIL